MTNPRKLGRLCQCGVSINDLNKSGRCRPCNLQRMNADPDMCARRGQSLRVNPAEKRRRALQMKLNRRMAAKNPVAVENIRQAAMRNLPRCFTPEALAKKRAAMPIVAKKISEYRLGWCPPDKRDKYRRLVRHGHLKAARAKEIILAEVRAEEAALSPFERQMRALERGGKVVANDARPASNQRGVA